MVRTRLVTVATGGLLSVAAGTVAAHLAQGDARAADLLHTGAVYGMIHAAALIATAAIVARDQRPSLMLAIAGWSLAAGLCLFSFGLFALGLTNWKWLARVTPFGGAALLVGWGALGLGALRGR